MMHSVMCAMCGKKDRIEVFKGKKVKNRNWEYFGKWMTNSNIHDRHYYKVLTDAKGRFIIDKDGWFKTRKVENPGYVPRTKPEYAEHWECKACFEAAVREST